MKKLLVALATLILVAIIVVSAIFLWRDMRYAVPVINLPPDTEFTSLKQTTAPLPTATVPMTVSTSPQVSPTIISTPPALNLKATFYAQAPFGNWDYPWQEACEEATILLIANEYFDHQWTAEQFNQQILNMVDWENKNFGDYKHTTMEQTEQMLQEVLHLKTKMHNNPNLATIKSILAAGHFIVLPLAGQELGNPYFSNGGPVYHVVVAKGYTADNKIITHDVGTKRGANYVYNWDTIDNALHDYADPINIGARRIIEVFPPQL